MNEEKEEERRKRRRREERGGGGGGKEKEGQGEEEEGEVEGEINYYYQGHKIIKFLCLYWYRDSLLRGPSSASSSMIYTHTNL